MLAEIKNIPKTTQQAEKLRTKDLQELLKILLATIIHWATSEEISNQKKLLQFTSEVNFVISATENKNKNSGLKKSTIAIITLNLIEIISSWEDMSSEEKNDTINQQKNEIRKYKVLYRSSKSGNR